MCKNLWIPTSRGLLRLYERLLRLQSDVERHGNDHGYTWIRRAGGVGKGGPHVLHLPQYDPLHPPEMGLDTGLNTAWESWRHYQVDEVSVDHWWSKPLQRRNDRHGLSWSSNSGVVSDEKVCRGHPDLSLSSKTINLPFTVFSMTLQCTPLSPEVGVTVYP